jgi:hypothetical protein
MYNKSVDEKAVALLSKIDGDVRKIKWNKIKLVLFLLANETRND